MIIVFKKYSKYFTDRELKQIKKIIYHELKKFNCKVKKIDIHLLNNKEILKINKYYLNHNYYTDIITFDVKNENNLSEIDIFISDEMIDLNSNEYKVEKKIELLRVVFHGILHITGMKDKKINEKKLMRKKEDELIQNFLFHVKQDDII